jgi:DNA (cytosine-5)-methyltransferase 1
VPSTAEADPPHLVTRAIKRRLDQGLIAATKGIPLSAIGASASSDDRLRSAAFTLGQTIALNFDQYWSRAKTAREGPVDVIDMFSGCGGMSAGFRAVNGAFPAFRLALAVDLDRVANKTYGNNLGLSPQALDVSRLAADAELLKTVLDRSGRRPGHPLILIGCAPCQGFSSHRNAAGRGDGRNSLFVDFARLAVKLQPDLVVVENVPELLTPRYWRFVRSAVETLEASGYSVQIAVHNMAMFGVPQERFRALLLARKLPVNMPRPFLRRGTFRTVRDAISKLTPIEAGAVDSLDPMHYTANHRPSTLATIRAVPKDGGNRPKHVGPACLRRAAERQGRGAYDDVYGRLHWGRPAITLTHYARNPASGRYVHPEQDRGLSVREAALLQGFPADYDFGGTFDDRFRQIGNAVPPIFAAALAAHLLGELSSNKPAGPSTGSIRAPVASSFSRLIPSLKAEYASEGHKA